MFGNQNMEEIGRAQAPALLALLRGNVLRFSLDMHGCRAVQRAFELVDEDEQRVLVSELHGHVHEALESPHANHVLQRAITLLRPSVMRFLLVELQACIHPAALARHPYGCRVLERLLEHFPHGWLEELITEILHEAGSLCRHAYGNFVMQHLLEHGQQVARQHIVEVLEREIAEVATHQSACSVLDKALSYGDFKDQRRLAGKVLSNHGLIVSMGSQRNGFAATQRLLKVVQGKRHEEALGQLKSGADRLQRSKHGRALLQTVWPEIPKPAASAALPPGRVRNRRS